MKLVKSIRGEDEEPTSEHVECERAKDNVETLRMRLAAPSYFMAAYNENLARRINRAEQETGHLWEDRYQCRRLDCEAAILTCALYIDLNPIRAGEAETPEAARCTSAFKRIQILRAYTGWFSEPRQQIPEDSIHAPYSWLSPLRLTDAMDSSPRGKASLAEEHCWKQKGWLPMTTLEYLQTLDWAGRLFRQGKRGAIPRFLDPILRRLNLNACSERFLALVEDFHKRFGIVVGTGSQLKNLARKLGRTRHRGLGSCREAFG